jgi:hypothetical protein
MEQQVEYLRFDCNRRGTAVQFAPIGIEHMIIKQELQARCLTRHNRRDINQGVLKDKSIIRQSLAAAFRALKGPLDEDLSGCGDT